MKAFFNREPLAQNSNALLSLGEIRPRGWLLKQLELEAESLAGRLDESWPETGENCGWPGGEKAPYYLNGLVNLAYVLDDEILKKKTQKYIEWILSSRRADGWFGPAGNDDYWPLIICITALYAYFTATLDKRVLELMDGFFKYEYRNLEANPLKEWACARGGDNIYMVLKMYNITGQQYLLELCRKLREQTLDWTTTFDIFPNMTALSKAVPWEKLLEGRAHENTEIAGTNRPYYGTMFHRTHGVNVAMGLKTPGVVSAFKPGFKEQTGFKNGWEKLMKYHGTANGMFTCDGHINGNSPTRGTESCAVAETMYSIETLMDVGDFAGGLPDILEKLAYNTLPAPYSKDMTRRQFLQQANQISCTDEPHGWYNEGARANVYSHDSESGCAATLDRGWPEFTKALWLATRDGGLTAVSYAPCYVEHVIDGVPVYMDVRGNYPFGENIEIEINTRRAIEFPLYLRIPYWAENTMIQLPGGEIMSVRAGETACIRERWNGMGLIRITFPMKPRIAAKPHQSCAVEVGPLVMVLGLAHEEKPCGDDIGLSASDEWRYAVVTDAPMKTEFSEEESEGFKNGEVPIRVTAKAIICDAWQKDGCDAGPLPGAVRYDKEKVTELTLIPYGYTDLRISQFPASTAGEVNT